MGERVKQRSKMFNKLSRKVGRALQEYAMIEPGDRVLVGISGGKDSMILLETLADRRRHLPFEFDIYAVHVMATGIGYRMDTDYLEQFCSALKVPLFLEEIKVDPGAEPDKAPCFICSWERRKRLFEMTREKDCNKLALGHHREDAIETLLLNMIYHGSISSLPQKLSMFGGSVRLIRPLLMIPEEELSDYAGLMELKMHLKSCPHEDLSRRKSAHELIRMMDQLNRDARRNLFRAMNNIYPDYLPD